MRPQVESGIPASVQRSSFQNATLQGTGEGLAFSVATHVEVPLDASRDERELQRYLEGVFASCPDGLHVEIQLGPDDEA